MFTFIVKRSVVDDSFLLLKASKTKMMCLFLFHRCSHWFTNTAKLNQLQGKSVLSQVYNCLQPLKKNFFLVKEMKSASLLLSFLYIIVSSYQAKYIFIHEDVHTGRDGKRKIFFYWRPYGMQIFQQLFKESFCVWKG